MHASFSEISPDSFPESHKSKKQSISSSEKTHPKLVDKGTKDGKLHGKGHARTFRENPSYAEQSSSSAEDESSNDRYSHASRKQNKSSSSREMFGKDGYQRPSRQKIREAQQKSSPSERPAQTNRNLNSQVIFFCQVLLLYARFFYYKESYHLQNLFMLSATGR